MRDAWQGSFPGLNYHRIYINAVVGSKGMFFLMLRALPRKINGSMAMCETVNDVRLSMCSYNVTLIPDFRDDLP